MYCYRFPDRAIFLALCDTLEWLSEGSLVAYAHNRAVDEVGPVEIVPGTYDEDGNELTAPVYDTSHHVNLQGTHPIEFDPYIVVVSSPLRQFAGRNGPSIDPNAPIEPVEEL